MEEGVLLASLRKTTNRSRPSLQGKAQEGRRKMAKKGRVELGQQERLERLGFCFRLFLVPSYSIRPQLHENRLFFSRFPREMASRHLKKASAHFDDL